MAAPWLDALLGKIRNASVEIPLSGGLNFANGLRAVSNRATGVVDVSQTNPPQAPAVQSEWVPTDGDSDTLEAIAEGHDAGFYLVGAQVTFAAEPSDSETAEVTFTFTWNDEVAAVSSATLPASQVIAVAPQLVYSDGAAAITVQASSDTADVAATATVRVMALRVSG